jgi:hypothetical protein
MDIIREMFTITFSQFMVGSVALLAFIPFQVLGRGFFKTCAWIFVVLGLLLWWVAPRPPVYGGLGSLFGATLWSTPKGREFGAIIVFVCLTILYLIALYRWSEGAVKTILGVAVAVGVFSVVNSAAAMRDPAMTPFQTEMLPANFILSALAMGTVFTGMLLGHYYLVKPDLPLKPLWKFTWLLFAVLIVQGAGLLTMVVKEFGPEQMKVVWGSNVFLTPWGLEFWSRILVGLVGTFVVAIVIVISLRMHATRTATGFYYIGIMTVLVGELMSRNLFRLTHLPL